MQTSKSIRELQRVVKGRGGLFSKFTLQEQLTAIESLGRTQSHDALKFLERLYSPTVSNEADFSVILASGASGASTGVESRSEKHSYQAASSFLRAELDFAVDLGNSFSGWRAEVEIAADRQCYLDSESHRIVRTAIATLQASLGAAE